MSSYQLPTVDQIAKLLSHLNPKVEASQIKVLDKDTNTGVVLIGYEVPDGDNAMVYVDGPDPEPSPVDVARGAAFAMVGGKCVMVCPPNPRRPTVVTDSFEVHQKDGKFILTVASRAGKMDFPCDVQPTFTPFSEGAMVRIWKFRGTVYHSNNKALQYDKTKWNGCAHKETFERLGLPSNEELFDDEVLTDPRCHIFIAVDYHFVTDSRQILTTNAGYIVYVGVHYAFDPSGENSPFSRVKSADGREYAGPWSIKPFTYDPVVMTVPSELNTVLPPLVHRHFTTEEAQDFLKYGFFGAVDFPDPRMTTGDSLHVQLGNYALRIQPTGSYWRNQMRAHDPNVRHMVYMHLATSFTNWHDFESQYMYLAPPTMQNLLDLFKRDDQDVTYFVYCDLMKLTPELAKMYQSEHARYRWLVFCNVLMSLSYQDQMNALSLFEEFEADRDRTIAYIFAHYQGLVNKRKQIYYTDPEKYEKVGHIHHDDIKPPKGKKYLVDANGFIRDVSSVKLYPGQSIALLRGPHPEVVALTARVHKTIEEDRLSKDRRQKDRTLINREFNSLKPDYIYQIMKQSKAWYTSMD